MPVGLFPREGLTTINPYDDDHIREPNNTAPSGKYREITPSDTISYSDGPAIAIWAGTGGTAVIIDLTDTAVTVVLLAGMNQFKSKRINATSLVASDLVAVY